MALNVELVRDPLPFLKVDAIGYGAKDTGEMGGGAAAAIIAAAGPVLIDAARYMLTAIRDFQEDRANRKLRVVLAPPTYDDYQAFESLYCRL